jgi:pyridoxine 4-dehydrogenase
MVISQPHNPASPKNTSWTFGDLAVRRIGFGSMRLTGRQAFGAGENRDLATSVDVVRAALDLGVNHFDTASFYFSAAFSANQILRAVIGRNDDVLVATKVGPSRDAAGEWMSWATPTQLRGQVERNIRELGRDHLDLVYLRVYGKGPITAHLNALIDLREAGLLRHIGLSTVTPAQLVEARTLTPVAAVQQRYSLGDRSAQTELVREACAAEGIAFVPYFAIAGEGREAGAPPQPAAAVTAVSMRHGATEAQVLIAWTLSRGPNVLAIPGTGDIHHLRENVDAGSLQLTAADLIELEDSFRL